MRMVRSINEMPAPDAVFVFIKVSCCEASVASVAAVHNCCGASGASVAAVHNLNIKER